MPSPKRNSKAKPKPAKRSPYPAAFQKFGKNKDAKLLLIGILVVSFVVLMVVINYFFVIKPDVKKEVLVQTLSQISGSNNTSGVMDTSGVASIDNEKFVVADVKNRRLVVFNTKGDFLKEWVEKDPQESDPKKLGLFLDVSTDGQGNIYTIDTNTAIGWGYDAEGHVVQRINLSRLGVYVPSSLSWDGNNFFIADTGQHRIEKLAPSGDMLETWGKHGDCKECFDGPLKMAKDNKGNYFAPDSNNKRVKYLDPDGKILNIIKLDTRPTCVAVDSQGRLFVASEEGSFVKVFSPGGKSYVGDLKDTKGTDMFANVRGMTFTEDGTLLLAEHDNIGLVKILPETAQTAAK